MQTTCRHNKYPDNLFVPVDLSMDSISIGSLYSKMLNWEIIHREPKKLGASGFEIRHIELSNRSETLINGIPIPKNPKRYKDKEQLLQILN